MEWIYAKDGLPKDKDLVLILLNYKKSYVALSRFYENFISGFSGEYKNVFIIHPHPQFPKPWLFTDQYRKIAITPKSKVDRWAHFDIFEMYKE
jgi:hypothetical protein